MLVVGRPGLVQQCRNSRVAQAGFRYQILLLSPGHQDSPGDLDIMCFELVQQVLDGPLELASGGLLAHSR